MVDFSSFGHPAFRGNPEITLLLTEHGGHVGFLAGGAGPRFWADQAVRLWIDGPGTSTL
jgi:predicted alpha/beta-fold hydrolase